MAHAHACPAHIGTLRQLQPLATKGSCSHADCTHRLSLHLTLNCMYCLYCLYCSPFSHQKERSSPTVFLSWHSALRPRTYGALAIHLVGQALQHICLHTLQLGCMALPASWRCWCPAAGNPAGVLVGQLHVHLHRPSLFLHATSSPSCQHSALVPRAVTVHEVLEARLQALLTILT